MQTRGRALFNLLKMSYEEDPSIQVEPWQVANYREMLDEELFAKLTDLGIQLDVPRFLAYADEASSPEELIETLWTKEEDSHYDQAYLLLFELWRRHLSKRQSLSIFCDELDHLIDCYDSGESFIEEKIQDVLSDLEQILDRHSDEGQEQRALFQEVSLYCAHDVESFIYDYISDQIDEGRPLLASELVDGFLPYIQNRLWFIFLQVRLMVLSDTDEADTMLSRLLSELEEKPDFELLLEIARYLVNRGSITHFLETVTLARDHIETEQDFQELLAISSEFCRLLDRLEEAESINDMLKKRAEHALESPLTPEEPTVEEYYRLIEDFERSEA